MDNQLLWSLVQVAKEGKLEEKNLSVEFLKQLKLLDVTVDNFNKLVLENNLVEIQNSDKNPWL